MFCHSRKMTKVLLQERLCTYISFIVKQINLFCNRDNIDDNELDSCAANDIEHVSVDKLMQESGMCLTINYVH